MGAQAAALAAERSKAAVTRCARFYDIVVMKLWMALGWLNGKRRVPEGPIPYCAFLVTLGDRNTGESLDNRERAAGVRRARDDMATPAKGARAS